MSNNVEKILAELREDSIPELERRKREQVLAAKKETAAEVDAAARRAARITLDEQTRHDRDRKWNNLGGMSEAELNRFLHEELGSKAGF